mgnify:CR=1 FL=1
MVKNVFCFLMVLCFSTIVKGQNYTIILGRPTDKSVTISILFDLNVDYYIEYGTNSGVYGKTTTNFVAKANVPDEIDLTGLNANTKYYYRVQYKSNSVSNFKVSSEYYFNTQRSINTVFTFTVESDEHLYDKKGIRSMYQISLNNQALDKPDFMLSLGDIFLYNSSNQIHHNPSSPHIKNYLQKNQ